MEKINQMLKEYIIEQSKKRLLPLYQQLLLDSNLFDDPEKAEELYYVLKRIGEQAEISQEKDLAHLILQIMSQFKKDGIKIRLDHTNNSLVKEGIALLLNRCIIREHATTSELSSSEFTDSPILKMVILDDDEVYMDWIQDHIDTSKYQVMPLPKEQAIDQLEKLEFDYLVVNMMLPEQFGFKLIQRFKEYEWSQHIPIITYTHSSDPQHEMDIIKSGVDVIIKKPFSLPLFYTYLETLREKNRQTSSTRTQSYLVEQEESTLLIEKERIRFQRFHSYFSILLFTMERNKALDENYTEGAIVQFMRRVYHDIFKAIRLYDETRWWSSDSIILLLPATRMQGAEQVAKRIVQMTYQSTEQQHLASFLKIGIVESELGYQNALHMLNRLEREMRIPSQASNIHLVPPLHSVQEQTAEKRIRLLIIDEDIDPSMLLRKYLHPEKWEIENCMEGRKALEHIMQFHPDVIICETKMSDLDGYSLCSSLRQFPQFNKVIFIFLTRQTLTQHIVRAFKAGADDYIFKPYSVQEIEARMSRHREKKMDKSMEV